MAEQLVAQQNQVPSLYFNISYAWREKEWKYVVFIRLRLLRQAST